MSQKDQKFCRKLTFDISMFKFQNRPKQKLKNLGSFGTNGSVGAKLKKK